MKRIIFALFQQCKATRRSWLVYFAKMEQLSDFACLVFTGE